MSTIARTAVLFLAAAALSPSLAVAGPEPSPGTWSGGIYEHTWGRGDYRGCQDLVGAIGCGAENLAGGDLNDEVSSYAICNNLGMTARFRVRLYVDSNYRNLFEDMTVTVGNGECVVRNTSRNDVASSFTIMPY